MRTLLLLAALAATGASAQISTDRPGLAFTASNVGAGVIQAEVGTPDATLNPGVDLYAVPVALRVGVTPGVEVRASASLLRVARLGGATDAEVGRGPLTVGARVALGLSGVEASAIAEVVVPDEGAVGFQANVPVSFSAGALGVTLVPGVQTGSGTVLNAVGLVSRAVGPLSGYAELGAFPSLDGGGGTPVLAGGGATLLLSDDLQVDAFFDAGVTDAAPDLLVGLGVSVRLGR